MTSIRFKLQLLTGAFLFCLLASASSHALLPVPISQTYSPSFFLSVAKGGPHLLVENEDVQKDENRHKSGSLILPLDSGKKDEKAGKKCMTVCNRWGKDCIIDPNRGRQCRRTCKEFGEECF